MRNKISAIFLIIRTFCLKDCTSQEKYQCIIIPSHIYYLAFDLLPKNYHFLGSKPIVICFIYYKELRPVMSFITSPAMISPTTEGTNAVDPGVALRFVRFSATS